MDVTKPIIHMPGLEVHDLMIVGSVEYTDIDPNVVSYDRNYIETETVIYRTDESLNPFTEDKQNES